jgi:hypothetical protein
MNIKAKLLNTIRANPRSVRFADACTAAELLGFVPKGGAGSHRTFVRANEPMLLNFQNRSGSIPPYQARQLLAMIDKYQDQP